MAEPQAAPAEGPAPTAEARERAAASAPASILFVGDVVGGIGRRTLLESLPVLR